MPSEEAAVDNQQDNSPKSSLLARRKLAFGAWGTHIQIGSQLEAGQPFGLVDNARMIAFNQADIDNLRVSQYLILSGETVPVEWIERFKMLGWLIEAPGESGDFLANAGRGAAGGVVRSATPTHQSTTRMKRIATSQVFL